MQQVTGKLKYASKNPLHARKLRIAHFYGASPASYRQVKVKVLVSLVFCYIVLAEPKGRKLILRRLPLVACHSPGHKHTEIFENANYIFI